MGVLGSTILVLEGMGGGIIGDERGYYVGFGGHAAVVDLVEVDDSVEAKSADDYDGDETRQWGEARQRGVGKGEHCEPARSMSWRIMER